MLYSSRNRDQRYYCHYIGLRDILASLRVDSFERLSDSTHRVREPLSFFPKARNPGRVTRAFAPVSNRRAGDLGATIRELGLVTRQARHLAASEVCQSDNVTFQELAFHSFQDVVKVSRGFNEGHIIPEEPLLGQFLRTVDPSKHENI